MLGGCMATYKCILCETEFEAKHKTALCPTCKATPNVCVICGKEFPKLYFPYDQKTCSAACRGKYRAETGIAKAGAAKMKQTKLDRYGTLDPAEVTRAKLGSDLPPKKCAYCGKEFVPNTPRQIYCTDVHYGACPVCGKQVEIKDMSTGPQACSERCRMTRINATCLERYGNKDAVNSEHAKALAKQHSLERYGAEYYAQTDQFKEAFKKASREKYGTDYPMQNKDVQEKCQQTSLERYGHRFYSQTDECKSHIKEVMKEKYGGFTLEHQSSLRSRYEETMMSRYGVIAPSQSPEIVSKIKANNLEKYGVEWASSSKEVRDKIKKTNLERYGVECSFGSKEVQSKSKQTCIQKYGGPNAMCSPELVELSRQRFKEVMLGKYGADCSMRVPELKEKISNVMQERYGVPWYVLTENCRQHNYRSVSIPNQKFAEALRSLGVETTFEYHIGHSPYDLKIVDSNVLIEIDPTFTHNCYDNIWHEPKNRESHLNKTKLADQNGYQCIHVFDWDSQESILSMLVNKEIIYARRCNLIQIDKRTAEQFTNLYHLQGSCRGQDIAYGLVYNGELVQIMAFGKPRYNKNYDYELLRLCTRHGIKILGGPSKLFHQFTQDFPDKSVISYCDYAKFSGQVYQNIGMNLHHISSPAKIWSKKDKYITDNYLRQHGYDRIFGANYGKGTSNEQLMLENGWLPVYDCGQKVFEYVP